MIVFRVNASSSIGIGHLARCRRLAIQFQKGGDSVVFVLDQINSFVKKYLVGFFIYELYSKRSFFLNEKEDAKLFLEYPDIKDASCVIVDDYRLSVMWEKAVSVLNKSVIVLDDQNMNKHQCDLLIDSTWEGEKTYERYKLLTDDNTTRLLGPEYLLLDEEFGFQNANNQVSIRKNNQAQLLLSLGGGGDLSILISIAQLLISEKLSNISFSINIVAGPYAINKDKLISFASEHDEVEVIFNQDGLYDYLVETDIYIGTSGGTLFEALSLQIPALTFSIGENQQHDIKNLENCGHYFHINSLNNSELEMFSQLAIEMILQLERIEKLYQKLQLVKIDGKGVIRVFNAIKAIVQGVESKESELVLNKFKNNIEIESGLSLIDDSYINRYLSARNLNTNLKQMTETNKVPRLSHYLWWLQKNKRTSYVFKKNGEDLLFIWHQSKKVRCVNVIVSGWFVATDNCSALDALDAITKHGTIIDNLFPKHYWIIITHKDNNFMQQFHQRTGFEDVSKGSAMETIIEDCFSNANTTNFVYYQRYIKEQDNLN